MKKYRACNEMWSRIASDKEAVLAHLLLCGLFNDAVKELGLYSVKW